VGALVQGLIDPGYCVQPAVCRSPAAAEACQPVACGIAGWVAGLPTLLALVFGVATASATALRGVRRGKLS